MEDEVVEIEEEVAEEVAETSLRDDLEAAFEAADAEEPGEEVAAEAVEASPEDKPEEGAGEEDSEEGEAEIDCSAYCRTEEDREAFYQLPTEQQQLLDQRYTDMESDYKSKLDTTAKDREYAESMRAAFSPFEAMIRAEGGSHEAAVGNLLNTAYTLRNGTPQQKTQLFDQLARAYSVDTDQLSAEPDVYVDPQIQELQNQVADQNRRFNELQTSNETAQSDAATKQVEAFMAETDENGNVAHPHFDVVGSDMLALMDAGIVKDLPEAYERAIWTHPETAPLMRKGIAEGVKQDVSSEKKSKLQKAKKAGGVAPGTSAPEPGQVQTGKNTLTQDLNAAWDALAS